MLRRSSIRPHRPWRLVAVLCALGFASACASSARVYSVVPVDREGAPVEIARIDLIRFDDGTRRALVPGESLGLAGQTLVIEGPVRADGTRRTESFAVDAVESLRRPLEDGTDDWIEVRTPADLGAFETLPRIQRIDTAAGRSIEFDTAAPRTARWSADRLAIVVEGPDPDDSESIGLDEIARIELFEPDALGSTLASPGFWIVGAAAAGLVIWLADAEDEDSLATN